MSYFSRSRIIGSLGLSAVLLATITGCSGGSSPRVPPPPPPPPPPPNPVTTPVSNSLLGTCDAEALKPNYFNAPVPDVEPGVPDVTANSRYGRWNHFPVGVWIPPNTDVFHREQTLAGFDEWVKATGGRASYRLMSLKEDADLVVSYLPQDRPQDLTTPHLRLGVTTTYILDNGFISNVDMKLFLYPDATTPELAHINQTVAAHEFGHALGLIRHSPNGDDLMYREARTALKPITVKDLNTLKTIYCNHFPDLVLGLKKKGPLTKIVIRD